ncbi:painting of fourth, isoform C [Drosophila ananassae]|uniref:Painting of fourth, isoform C n=1 Tax=Drosophila ananassae TaxID=7217 RepID=A0A0P8Y3K7_DROAN|nr:protein painting of fourth isoform X2 [Drosophila ananassae]KPU76270.1 painting of fourth, isoform C [Drosophila ananassae]
MDSKRAALETGDGPDAKRMATAEEQEKPEELLPGDGNQIALGKHIPPYTGNGCSPSMESFMFQQTPAGSQLLPWATAECQTSENDLDLDKSTSGNKKTEAANSKLSRRELAKLRREHTMRALALERELTVKPGHGQPSVVLLIRFPDPEITAPMLAGLSKDIRDVVLPSSVAPRYCLVHLKPGADVEATIADINKVRFGGGYLQAEHKPFSDEEQAEFIDPCSLYVSNIPFNMATSAIKAYFTHAMRVDIGVLKREKRARYAFVRYASPEVTMDAFRELVGSPLNSRTLTVRYRRLRKRAGLPTVQCTNSNLTITSPVGDDDNADCKVISPPPVESITISDSDNCSDSSADAGGRRRRKNKMTDHEKEIQKLKRQMAEYGSIIKNLQVRQNIGANLPPKEEPCANPSACIPVLGSTAVHLMRDIKTERAYLGIPDEGTPDPEPAHKPTTQPEEVHADDRIKTKKFDCFGWLFSGPARRRKSAKQTQEKTKASTASPDKEGRLEELYAQLESDAET